MLTFLHQVYAETQHDGPDYAKDAPGNSLLALNGSSIATRSAWRIATFMKKFTLWRLFTRVNFSCLSFSIFKISGKVLLSTNFSRLEDLACSLADKIVASLVLGLAIVTLRISFELIVFWTVDFVVGFKVFDRVFLLFAHFCIFNNLKIY